MRNAIRSRHEAEQGRSNPRDELTRYLGSPLAEGVTDVVAHWGVSSLHESTHPFQTNFVPDSTKAQSILPFVAWLVTI